MTTRYLIVNADDFGATPAVNRGILEAHTRGVVTSASLMVDAPGSAEAVRLARWAPRLGLGLHVVLECCDGGGPRALRLELTRQVGRFVELTGRAPGHIDSHRDIHRDARLLPAFLEMAQRWSAPLRGYSTVQPLSSFYGKWAGETHPEQIGVESLAAMLASEVGDGVTELVCHPGYAGAGLVSSYAEEREIEVATLCDPRVRSTLERLHIELTNHEARQRLVPHPR